MLAGVLSVSVAEAPAQATTTTKAVSLTMTAGSFSTKSGSPTTLPPVAGPVFAGTETSTTGAIATGVLTTLVKKESNEGSTETIIISQVTATKGTGSVTTAGQVSIGLTIDYEVHITKPVTAKCITPATHVVLSSASSYTATTKTVTVADTSIIVPDFSTGCIAQSELNTTFSGRGGSLSLTLHGTLAVPPPATPTTLALSTTPASPQLSGTSVTLKATVKKSTGALATAAKGSVTFRDGTAVLGTASVSSGSASVTTTTLPVGTDKLTATFGGGGGYKASASTALTYVIEAKPTVSVNGLPATVTGGSATEHTFTVTVTNPSNGAALSQLFVKMVLSGINTPSTTDEVLQYKDTSGAWCTMIGFTTTLTTVYGYFAGAASSCTHPTSFSLAKGTALTVDFRIQYPTPTSNYYGTQTVTAGLYDGTCSSGACTPTSPFSTATTAPTGTGSVTVVPPTPFSSTSVLNSDRASQKTVRKTFDVLLGSKVAPTRSITPSNHLPAPTGIISYVIGSTTIATSTVAIAQGHTGYTKVTLYDTAGLTVGTTYTVVATYTPKSYTGHTIYKSSTYSFTFKVLAAPTGTPFVCSVSGLSSGTVPAYVNASGTTAPAVLATSTKKIGVSDVQVTLVMDPAVGASFYNTGQKAASIGFSPTGASATAGPVTFTGATATSSEGVGTWTGITTSVPLKKGTAPGSEVAVGNDKISWLTGLTTWTCTAATAAKPAPVTSFEVAGTTLTASPTGSATVGSPVTLTAHVYPTSATGGTTSQVQFFDGTKSLGTSLVSTTGSSRGTATLSVSTLAVGSHSFTATWTGTAKTSIPFNVSSAVPYTVNPTPVTAPVVTTQPTSAGVKAGQSATFTTAASGTSPSVQWQVSADGGTTWSDITGATSDSYSVVGTKGNNDTQYRAVFTNAAGSATTNPATLFVTARGYRLTASNGGVYAYGNAPFYGSAGGIHLNAPIVGSAATPTGGGYWLVASDGGIFSYGTAPFSGSMGGKPLNAPIVGMAAAPTGHGYWEVASDGGIFAFGAAGFYGSMGGKPLNQPVVAMAAAPTGRGYYEVAADGGIFAFGSAAFHGSTGSMTLDRPITSMATTPTGGGYWLVASDGGIFAFGSAHFYGAAVGGAGAGTATSPVVGMLPTTDGAGYLEVEANGRVVQFGDAALAGTALTETLSGASIVSITS